MIILRQKEFISTKLKLATHAKIAGSNIRFLGNIGRQTLSRGAETVKKAMIFPSDAGKSIVDEVIKSNKETLQMAKNSATSLGSKKTSLKKKLGIAANIATDLHPTTAFGKHLAQEAYETAGMKGKDVVASLSQMATNPAQKSGEILANFRQGGHGQTYLGGKWLGPGVNKWCIGVAPDSVLTGIGNFTTQSIGAGNIQREQQLIQNSREARRFARSYDRTVGRVLNPIHNAIGKVISKA